MGKRGDRKRLMRSLKRTAKRIPLGAEHLPKWLKSHFPHIYAQHVAYRMINGRQIKPGVYRNKYGRGFEITEEMLKSDWGKSWAANAKPSMLVVPPHLKAKAEVLIGRS